MPTVLVIEDDASTREATCKLLETEGYRAICAENGWDALRALEREAVIDLILVDVFMPGMDGSTFLQIVQKENRRQIIPIIVTTASERAQAQFKGNHTLLKGSPDYVENLLKTVRGILDGKGEPRG